MHILAISPHGFTFPQNNGSLCLLRQASLAGVCPSGPTTGTSICSRARDPRRSQTGTLGSNCVPAKDRGLSGPLTPKSQDPRAQGRPWQYPRVLGRGQSCHSHRVHPHADKCVSVGAAPPGLGGVGGGRPSVPRLAIQMAPFTKLLLLCPCRSLRLVFPGPFFKTGGKEEATGGPPQLLCGSLVGRGQGFSRAWSSGPHLELCQVPPRLGLGRETASLLQAFAQAVPAPCCTLPPWCHW